VHVAPQVIGRADETQAVASILRTIVRERRFTSFSITAFNIDQRSMIYRQGNGPTIDFPALGRAVKSLHFGTVSVQHLREKDRWPQFLLGLFAEELASQRPDVLMIVGPKRSPEKAFLRNFLKQLPHPGCPAFYLNYDADPEMNSWGDLLGSVVDFWKGTEYSISKPQDLFWVWPEIVSRLTVSSVTRAAAANEPEGQAGSVKKRK
jgi:hypothetical protein